MSDDIQTVRERGATPLEATTRRSVEVRACGERAFVITESELDRIEAVVKAALTYCDEPTEERFAELQGAASDFSTEAS